ncbi:hypothetical protein V7068_21770 [Bacillus sp. JJ634]
MRKCQIDHSHEDVAKKLETQKQFIPELLFKDLQSYLMSQRSQHILNELFHLLKKYDLATAEEQNIRNKKLVALIALIQKEREPNNI